MSKFGEDLIQSLSEALAHAKGEGLAVVHAPVTPREIRRQAKLTQEQVAPLMGMSLSGYRKWEQGTRRISRPAATLPRVIQKEPEAVRRALIVGEQGKQKPVGRLGAERTGAGLESETHLARCSPMFEARPRCRVGSWTIPRPVGSSPCASA